MINEFLFESETGKFIRKPLIPNHGLSFLTSPLVLIIIGISVGVFKKVS